MRYIETYEVIFKNQESRVSSSQNTLRDSRTSVSALVKGNDTYLSGEDKKVKDERPKAKKMEDTSNQEESKQQNACPELSSFEEMRLSTSDVKTFKSLENLITTCIETTTESVKQCYTRPNRAAKLRKNITENLMYFQTNYQEVTKSERSKYLDLMTELVAMYIDMEIKAACRQKEKVKKVVSRIISTILLFLDKSEDHILDAILKAKLINKQNKGVCLPILGRIVNQVSLPLSEMSYVRYLLIFKIFKKVVQSTRKEKQQKSEEEKRINKLAVLKLKPPDNFVERAKAFTNVLPKIPPKSKKNVTYFFMRAKLNLKSACTAFLEGVKEFQESLCSADKEFFRCMQLLPPLVKTDKVDANIGSKSFFKTELDRKSDLISNECTGVSDCSIINISTSVCLKGDYKTEQKILSQELSSEPGAIAASNSSHTRKVDPSEKQNVDKNTTNGSVMVAVPFKPMPTPMIASISIPTPILAPVPVSMPNPGATAIPAPPSVCTGSPSPPPPPPLPAYPPLPPPPLPPHSLMLLTPSPPIHPPLPQSPPPRLPPLPPFPTPSSSSLALPVLTEPPLPLSFLSQTPPPSPPSASLLQSLSLQASTLLPSPSPPSPPLPPPPPPSPPTPPPPPPPSTSALPLSSQPPYSHSHMLPLSPLSPSLRVLSPPPPIPMPPVLPSQKSQLPLDNVFLLPDSSVPSPIPISSDYQPLFTSSLSDCISKITSDVEPSSSILSPLSVPPSQVSIAMLLPCAPSLGSEVVASLTCSVPTPTPEPEPSASNLSVSCLPCSQIECETSAFNNPPPSPSHTAPTPPPSPAHSSASVIPPQTQTITSRTSPSIHSQTSVSSCNITTPAISPPHTDSIPPSCSFSTPPPRPASTPLPRFVSIPPPPPRSIRTPPPSCAIALPSFSQTILSLPPEGPVTPPPLSLVSQPSPCALIPLCPHTSPVLPPHTVSPLPCESSDTFSPSATPSPPMEASLFVPAFCTPVAVDCAFSHIDETAVLSPSAFVANSPAHALSPLSTPVYAKAEECIAKPVLLPVPPLSPSPLLQRPLLPPNPEQPTTSIQTIEIQSEDLPPDPSETPTTVFGMLALSSPVVTSSEVQLLDVDKEIEILEETEGEVSDILSSQVEKSQDYVIASNRVLSIEQELVESMDEMIAPQSSGEINTTNEDIVYNILDGVDASTAFESHSSPLSVVSLHSPCTTSLHKEHYSSVREVLNGDRKNLDVIKQDSVQNNGKDVIIPKDTGDTVEENVLVGSEACAESDPQICIKHENLYHEEQLNSIDIVLAPLTQARDTVIASRGSDSIRSSIKGGKQKCTITNRICIPDVQENEGIESSGNSEKKICTDAISPNLVQEEINSDIQVSEFKNGDSEAAPFCESAIQVTAPISFSDCSFPVNNDIPNLKPTDTEYSDESEIMATSQVQIQSSGANNIMNEDIGYDTLNRIDASVSFETHSALGLTASNLEEPNSPARGVFNKSNRRNHLDLVIHNNLSEEEWDSQDIINPIDKGVGPLTKTEVRSEEIIEQDKCASSDENDNNNNKRFQIQYITAENRTSSSVTPRNYTVIMDDYKNVSDALSSDSIDKNNLLSSPVKSNMYPTCSDLLPKVNNAVDNRKGRPIHSGDIFKESSLGNVGVAHSVTTKLEKVNNVQCCPSTSQHDEQGVDSVGGEGRTVGESPKKKKIPKSGKKSSRSAVQKRTDSFTNHSVEAVLQKGSHESVFQTFRDAVLETNISDVHKGRQLNQEITKATPQDMLLNNPDPHDGEMIQSYANTMYHEESLKAPVTATSVPYPSISNPTTIGNGPAPSENPSFWWPYTDRCRNQAQPYSGYEPIPGGTPVPSSFHGISVASDTEKLKSEEKSENYVLLKEIEESLSSDKRDLALNTKYNSQLDSTLPPKKRLKTLAAELDIKSRSPAKEDQPQSYTTTLMMSIAELDFSRIPFSKHVQKPIRTVMSDYPQRYLPYAQKTKPQQSLVVHNGLFGFRETGIGIPLSLNASLGSARNYTTRNEVPVYSCSCSTNSSHIAHERTVENQPSTSRDYEIRERFMHHSSEVVPSIANEISWSEWNEARKRGGPSGRRFKTPAQLKEIPYCRLSTPVT